MLTLDTVGDFTWFWSDIFFIETTIGNFVWSDPDYNGDNTIKQFDGDIKKFCKEVRYPHGRCKGKHTIGKYCGNQVNIIPND